MFERNTVVWAKVRGFPWWPSYTEEKMPNGHYKVQFIGEKTYQYVPPDKIKSWAENFEEYTKVKRNKKTEKFFSAVELGVNINANIINFEDQYLFISNCMKKLSHFTEEDVRKFCQSIKNMRKKVVTIPKKNITKNLPTKMDSNKKGVFHKKVEPVQYNNNNNINNSVNVNVNGSNTLQLNKSKLHSSITSTKLNYDSHSHNNSNSSNSNSNSSNINNHNHHSKIIIHLNNNNNNINHKRLSRSTDDKDDPITLNEFNNTHSSTITRAPPSNNFRNDKGQTQLDSYFPNQHLHRHHQSQKMNNKVLDFSKEIEELVSCQTEIKEDLEFIFTKLEKYNILSHLPIEISKLDFTKRDKNERVILTKKELINYLIFLCSIIQIPSDINKYLSSLIKELKSFPHD